MPDLGKLELTLALLATILAMAGYTLAMALITFVAIVVGAVALGLIVARVLRGDRNGS